MKVYLLLISVVAGLLLEGCASTNHEIVLKPVGPASRGSTKFSQGTLLVYSAWDPAPRFNDALTRNHYTDYQLFSATGNLLKTVHNSNEVESGPKSIELDPGSYRVVARANGYGWITVPVVIEGRNTTTVHLEGGSFQPDQVALGNNGMVRLPGGEIVGYQALTSDVTKQ